MATRGSPNAPCPCGRALKYKQCCLVHHRGRPAPPPALMRARYSAYAVGEVDFLIDTTHPLGPHFRPDRAAWRADLVRYCRTHTFTGLTVLAHTTSPDERVAWVAFVARLTDGAHAFEIRERSRFERDGTRWKYVGDDDERPDQAGGSSA